MCACVCMCSGLEGTSQACASQVEEHLSADDKDPDTDEEDAWVSSCWRVVAVHFNVKLYLAEPLYSLSVSVCWLIDDLAIYQLLGSKMCWEVSVPVDTCPCVDDLRPLPAHIWTMHTSLPWIIREFILPAKHSWLKWNTSQWWRNIGSRERFFGLYVLKLLCFIFLSSPISVKNTPSYTFHRNLLKCCKIQQWELLNALDIIGVNWWPTAQFHRVRRHV